MSSANADWSCSAWDSFRFFDNLSCFKVCILSSVADNSFFVCSSVSVSVFCSWCFSSKFASWWMRRSLFTFSRPILRSIRSVICNKSDLYVSRSFCCSFLSDLCASSLLEIRALLSFLYLSCSSKLWISCCRRSYSALLSLISCTVTWISASFISSDNAIYSSAILASILRGSTRSFRSKIISCTRLRLFIVSSSFCSVSTLRFLYFNTPAASSISCRRSLGLAFSTWSTFPWEIILKASRPRPLSRNNSVISLSLTFWWFKKYSLSPERKSLRVISTLSESTARLRSILLIVRVTCAKLVAFLSCAPEKMISSIFAPRRDFADCSPSTHLIASVILLFPEPFGPTIAVTPSSNSTVVLSANDLKPVASTDCK